MKKKLVISLIIICSILLVAVVGIYIFMVTSFNNNIPVLAYHKVVDSPSNSMEVSKVDFEKQMKWLYDNHYTSLSMDEFYDWKMGNKNIDGKKVVITFDDGWESYYTNALPILEKYDLKSTEFIILSNIDKKGYLTSKEIEKLKKNEYVTLGYHTYNNHNEEAAKSENYDLYNEDFKKAKEYNFKYFAYPYGISNNNYIKALKDNNYLLAFKFDPSIWAKKKQNNYLVTRVPIYNDTSFFKFKMKVLLNLK